jgi:uncharacterized membrane protein YcaP (DUF421 family)
LMVVLRILGKRMDGQLTLVEMAVMITFGAIVSVPMQMPERGILMGAVALLCVLAFQRGINWLGVKNEKVEDVTQGTMSTLVKDGVLQLDEMQRAGISKQYLFAALRNKKVLNLGKIKRVYFEACGLINVYEQEDEQVGLPILPPDEMELAKSETKTVADYVACTNCGHVTNTSERPCSVCGERKWMEAVK